MPPRQQATFANPKAPQSPLRRLSTLLCLTALAVSSPAGSAEALVAVAANFASPIERLRTAFESGRGHRLTIVIGSTGKFYAQIRNGAPFDVLLAADQARPRRLAADGLALPSTRVTYAVGRLALWSPDPNRVLRDGALTLRARNFRYLAIANPELAPYGAASKQVLQSLQLWVALEDRIVMGQNIGQTFSLVASGNAELGFVALSAVLHPPPRGAGSRWDVPPQLHAPIRQDAILLNHGVNNAAARAFLEFLRHPAARAIIEDFGYGTD